MPRRTADRPSWDRLYEVAAGQDGLLALDQIAAAGYSSPLLAHHLKSGNLVRVLRGVYRLAHYPSGPIDDLVALWLWSGRAAVVSHESALALHGLSDALPSKHHVTFPLAWKARRIHYPPSVVPHFADATKGELAPLGVLPITTPVRTVVDCIMDHVQPDLVEQAIRDGVRRGAFSHSEVRAATRARRAE